MSWYRESSRRRPADGIRAQTQSGQFGKTWWAGKWLAALERLIDSARLGRGRSYARSGQVLNIDIQPGQVNARVQGSRPTPYKVQINIRPIAAHDWERVADALSAQAIFAAKLLAGEMPPDIVDAFASAGVSLFPATQDDLQTECSCPDWANPCKHVAAVYYLLGEQFDADPFLIFRLRGKSKDEIMSMLRTRRTITEAAETSAEEAVEETGATEAEPAIPLEECLENFWEAAAGLDDLHIAIERPVVDAALLKRLGTPGFWRASGDFMTMFGTVYRTVTEAALAATLGEA